MRPKNHILFLILAAFSLALKPGVYHEIRFVYDGDTLLLEGGEKVRYLGINAPEIDHKGGKSEFMANEARDFNQKMVNGGKVRLEFDQEKRDRHGRLLAYVFLENGDMVNALLVRKGLAHVMFSNRNLKYRDLLLDSQRKAVKKKLGIWSRPFKEEEKFYLGNWNSYRFHRPNCSFGRKTSRRNIIRFKSRYDAFWAGYSPCKQCRP